MQIQQNNAEGCFHNNSLKQLKIINSEGLEKGYDRFQQLLSQLEAHGAEVSTEDANHKFLRSLPPAWSNLAMTMRTNPEIDTLSIDDFKSSTNKVSMVLLVPTVLASFLLFNHVLKKNSCGFADEVLYSLFAKLQRIWTYISEIWKQIGKRGRRVRVDGKTPVGFDKKKLGCFNCHNTGHFARECTAKGTHDGKKKRDSLYQHQEAGKQEKNQMGLLTRMIGCHWGELLKLRVKSWHLAIRSSMSYEEEMNFSVFNCSKEDSIGKPLYSRFTKTNDFKGVPQSLSGDYTTKPQEESDDFCMSMVKRVLKNLTLVSQMTILLSILPVNDSEGSCGNTSEHSFETESESLSVSNEMSTSRLVVINEKVVSNCAKHVKTPRQPLKDNQTHRKNWNDVMEKELGEGYSFTKKKCFVCGSLSHLIKDCDYYEKKMAREAEVKRVVNTGNGVAKPVWTNANRVNHSNKFVPRSVQLNAGRPNTISVRPNINTDRTNINSVRPNINTGRININSVRPRVNVVSSNVNTVRSRQPVPNKSSNSFSPKRPQVNQINQRRDFLKSHSSVRRSFAKTTTQMSHSNAVKGNWGSAVKTSAGFAEIVDFLRGSNLRYALSTNPTIYDSLVKQFWQTATADTLANGTLELQATIDTSEYIVTEASIRSKLQLADASGITMLLNNKIFEGIGEMGYPTDGSFTFWKSFFTPQWRFLVHHLLHYLSSKSGGWDQFGSNIATALICLSTGRVYNFSKLIFDGMVANLKSKTKFLMYPRFLQLILDIQTETKHPYLVVALTKKIFRNMKRSFRGAPRPLLPAMLLVATTNPSAGQEHPAVAQSQPSSSTIPVPSISSPPVQSPTTIPAPIPASIPTPTPIPKTDTEPMEHTFEEPSPAHQHFSPPQEHAQGQMTVDDLLHLVPQLVTRIDSLETDLKQTKLTMGSAIVKLVKKVKKLEGI
ncbi:synaptobrevin, longin-like domain protein, partial [Tanacetum coccineum]